MIKKFFTGRIGRGLFFISTFFPGIIGGILQSLFHDFKASHANDISFNYIFISYVYIFVIILLVIFLISIHIKRFHDFGKSGYWVFLYLIPYVNFIVFIYLIFKKGDNKKNKYGPQPALFVF